MALAVSRPVLHHRAKFHEDSQHVAEISRFFVIFKMAAADVLHFQKFKMFNILFPAGGQNESACRISSKSVKWLQRYSMAIERFSKWRLSAILDFSNSNF